MYRIAQLDAITGLADSFDPNANGPVDAITVQGDGKILVGGQFHNALASMAAARHAQPHRPAGGGNGAVDAGSTRTRTVVVALVSSQSRPQADGKILIGGQIHNALAERRRSCHAQQHRPAGCGKRSGLTSALTRM